MFKLDVKSWWNGDAVRERLKAGARQGARQAAEFVAERARMYCPVDSGDLKRSIRVPRDEAGDVWMVVATMPYAGHVEYGTEHHTGNVSYIIPPNPFMRRAMADGRREFPRILKEAMVTNRRGEALGATIKAGG